MEGKAWVADPDKKDLPEENVDLSNVPKEDDRCLLRLTDFLTQFPAIPLNVEMKKSFNRKINEADRKGLKDNIRAFCDILKRDINDRTIVVVSAIDHYIDEFREINGETFATGLSTQEQFVLLLNIIGPRLKDRALETSYSPIISNKAIVGRRN